MLSIDPEKVRQIVVLARLFDGLEELSDSGSIFDIADAMAEISEGMADAPAYDELRDDIRDLNEEEQINLVALVWVGRGTYSPAEWEQAVSEARHAHNRRTVEYLASLPRLCDYLEDGLAAIEEIEGPSSCPSNETRN